MTEIHVVGVGFVGAAIASACASDSRFNVKVYERKNFDLQNIQDSHKLTLSAEDVVVFAAAKVPVRTLDDLITNLEMIRGFVRLVGQQKFSYLLNISSDAIYLDQELPIDEASPIGITSYHSLMHIVREFILEEQFAGKLGNLRPTLIYGTNDPHCGYGPNRFVSEALSSQPIGVIGGGEELRDHVFIKDVARIAKQMIIKKVLGPINAVTGHVKSFAEIAQIVSNTIPGSQTISMPRTGPIPHRGYRAFIPTKSKMLFEESFEYTDILSGIQETIGEKRND